MAQDPGSSLGPDQQRGVFLTIEDLDRLMKSFESAIKQPLKPGQEPPDQSCGIVICGNCHAV